MCMLSFLLGGGGVIEGSNDTLLGKDDRQLVKRLIGGLGEGGVKKNTCFSWGGGVILTTHYLK